jgi:hypothetical protein
VATIGTSAARGRDGQLKSDIADDDAGDMPAAGPPSGVSVGGKGHALTTDALRQIQRGDHRFRCTPPGRGEAGADGPSLEDRQWLISMKVHAVFKRDG